VPARIPTTLHPSIDSSNSSPRFGFRYSKPNTVDHVSIMGLLYAYVHSALRRYPTISLRPRTPSTGISTSPAVLAARYTPPASISMWEICRATRFLQPWQPLACSMSAGPGSADHFKRHLTELTNFTMSREAAFIAGHQMLPSIDF